MWVSKYLLLTTHLVVDVGVGQPRLECILRRGGALVFRVGRGHVGVERTCLGLGVGVRLDHMRLTWKALLASVMAMALK